MKTNGSNANQVATTKEKKGTLGEWLNERKDSLNQALPANTVNVDRFMQSAFLAITNPKMPDLVNCSKDSIFRSLREAAAYGLELNGMLGQAYLIPYNETSHIEFKKTDKDNILKFGKYLQDNGITVTIRKEFGSKVMAACGQLRANYEEVK